MYQSSHFSWLGDRKSSFDLKALASAMHYSLSSANSKTLLEKVEAEDWLAVVSIRCDPRDYPSPSSYFRDAIPASFLKKLVDLPLGLDVEAATFNKWISSENKCFKTNQRLYPFLAGKIHHLPSDRAISRHLSGIRKIIKSWIGESPPREIELSFSKGSTLTERGQLATIAHKIRKSPSSTPQLDNIGYPHFVGTLWHHNMVDAGLTPLSVPGGEYFTVPKTSLIRRSAELQPTLNLSLQLGIGKALRARLRANTGLTLLSGIPAKGPGWDLRRAQAIHSEVACRASVDQSFCTIDLSSASDTISKVLVESLIPASWFRLMDGARTHRVLLPKERGGGYRYLEKFSSMGNGFTFELETIIFAAVACYVSRHEAYWGELGFDVFVYGDDIIVRDELYLKMKSILVFLGFELNTEKSFFGSHPFRESCGGDFFNGVNVRCTNLEKHDNLSTSEVVSTVNQVKHLCERFESVSLSGLNRVWFKLLEYLPSGIRRLRGPALLGDTVVYDPDEGSWIIRRTPYVVEVMTLQGDPCDAWIPWHRFDPATCLATAVLGFGDGFKGLLPKNPALKLKTQWTTLSCVSAPL